LVIVIISSSFFRLNTEGHYEPRLSGIKSPQKAEKQAKKTGEPKLSRFPEKETGSKNY